MAQSGHVRLGRDTGAMVPHGFGEVCRGDDGAGQCRRYPRRRFGEEGDGYLRLALVENENRIRQGLRQMRRALTEMEKGLSDQ